MLIYNGQALVCPTRQRCREIRSIRWVGTLRHNQRFECYANSNANNPDACSKLPKLEGFPLFERTPDLRMTRCH